MFKLTAVLTVAALAVAGCDVPSRDQRGNDRWATTENTNVKIDWDKVNKAYQTAEGPEDFEKKVNEIYEGSEVISVAVQDLDDKSQVVTGFFDRNTSGTVDDDEKIFTIRRDVTGDGSAQVQTQGHGHYAGYHSPMMSIVTGMVMGAMLSSALSPGYRPAYTQPYATNAARNAELRNQRSAYRAQNPGKYAKPAPSKTGRTYGGGGGTKRSGARFGIRRAPGQPRPTRLGA